MPEQLKTRLLTHRRTRETMQKEIRIVRRSHVLHGTVCLKKNGKFQMSGLIGLCNSVPGKGMVSEFLSLFYSTQ